jgi:hypothetical protein
MDMPYDRFLAMILKRHKWNLSRFVFYLLTLISLSACNPEELNLLMTSSASEQIPSQSARPTENPLTQTSTQSAIGSYTATPIPTYRTQIIDGEIFPNSPSSTQAWERTSTPESTPIAPSQISPSPTAILPNSGLWFFYWDSDDKTWYAVSKDGTQKYEISTQFNGKKLQLEKIGKSYGAVTFSIDKKRHHRILMIQNLTDPKKFKVIRLHSYYDDPQTVPSTLEDDNQNQLPEDVCGGDYLWSPGGRYLAFTAAIEGPTSDLYVYDTLTDNIRRLTNGPYEAVIDKWSLDGEWIIHSAIQSCAPYNGVKPSLGLWAAAADGSQIIQLEGASDAKSLLGWFNFSVFIMQDTIFASEHDFRLINYKTGEIKTLFEGWFTYLGRDPVRHFAVIFIPEIGSLYGEPTGYEPGIYTLSNWVDGPIYSVPYDYREIHTLGVHWDKQYQRIIIHGNPFIQCGEGEVNAFNIDGSILCVGRIDLPSPDGNWNVIAGPEASLTNMKNGDRKDLSSFNVDWVMWREDSLGFFAISTDKILYYFELSQEQPKLIDDDIRTTEYFSYKWIRVD